MVNFIWIVVTGDQSAGIFMRAVHPVKPKIRTVQSTPAHFQVIQSDLCPLAQLESATSVIFRFKLAAVRSASVRSHIKGRVERIFFFASFKLPLFNEYEMVFIIA